MCFVCMPLCLGVDGGGAQASQEPAVLVMCHRGIGDMTGEGAVRWRKGWGALRPPLM